MLRAGLIFAIFHDRFLRRDRPGGTTPPPCHPNPNAAADAAAVAARGDILNVLGPLKDRLVQLTDLHICRCSCLRRPTKPVNCFNTTCLTPMALSPTCSPRSRRG